MPAQGLMVYQEITRNWAIPEEGVMKVAHSSKGVSIQVLDRSWNAADLIRQPSVKKMIKENPKFKKQIELAARILSEDSDLKELEDAVGALKHSAGGII
jgi:hypothetical protein